MLNFVGYQLKLTNHLSEIRPNVIFPRHNRFNKSHALELDINTKACKGTPNFIQYVEHVVIKTTFYHYRRGATEILIVSPSGTRSWVLKEREKDIRGGEFHEWDFLSTHFWGENPTGKWRIIFYSKGMFCAFKMLHVN